MRQIYKYIVPAVLAVLTLGACENEVDEPDAVSDYPSFTGTIEGVQSRASETSWDAGDKIGIFGGDASNVSYITENGDGNFTVEKAVQLIKFNSDDSVEFKAYYPYGTLTSSGTYKGKITFVTGTNTNTTPNSSPTYCQTQTNQKSYDFLWAKRGGSKASPRVDFEFAHMMSKLTFVFINGEGMDVSTITKYSTAIAFYGPGVFDPTTGKCTTRTTPTTKKGSIYVEPTKITENEPAPPIIIIPQKLSTTNLTLTITAEAAGIGTITGNLTFKDREILPGNNYQFVIKVSKTGLTVKESTIKDWTEVDRGNGWET